MIKSKFIPFCCAFIWSPVRFSKIRKVTVRTQLSNEHLHEVILKKLAKIREMATKSLKVGNHSGLRVVSFGHVDLTGGTS